MLNAEQENDFVAGLFCKTLLFFIMIRLYLHENEVKANFIESKRYSS